MKRSVQHWIRSAQENLRDRLSGLASGRRPVVARRDQAQLNVEPLEDRSMLAVTAALVGTTLTITTNDAADHVQIASNGTNVTVSSDNAAVAGATNPLNALVSKIVISSSDKLFDEAKLVGSASADFGSIEIDVTADAVDVVGSNSFYLDAGKLTVDAAKALTVDGRIWATNDISLKSGAGISIEEFVISTIGTLTLTAAGGVSQTSSGTINVLRLSATGTFVNLDVSGSNFVQNVSGASTGGDFEVKANSKMTVASAGVTAVNGNLTLNAGTDPSNDNLTISGALNATTAGKTVTLVSVGKLSQTAPGLITTPTLIAKGTSVDLDVATNLVGAVSGSASTGNFEFKSGDALTVNAALTATAGDVVLTNAGALAVNAAVTAAGAGQTVKLDSTGAVSQIAAGVISAAKVAASGTSVTLTQANLVSQLSGAASTGDFRFRSNLDLTVIDDTAGAPAGFKGVTATLGDVALTTGGTDKNLTLNAATTASAAAKSVALNSSGALGQNAAGVVAATSVNAQGDSVALDAASNAVSNIRGGASAGDFTFKSNLDLTVDAAVTATGGDLALTAEGDKAITFSASATAATAGETAKFTASQFVGLVANAPAATIVEFNTPNDITFSATTKTAAGTTNFSQAEATALNSTTVRFVSTKTGGTIKLVDDGAGAPNDLIDFTLAATNVVLSAQGEISQASGERAKATNLAASGAAVLLGGSNQISKVAGAAAAGDFDVHSTLALQVGTVDGVVGVTANGSGQTVKIVSSGAVTQEAGLAGKIDADKAAVQGTSVVLTGPNEVSQASGSATAGNFEFTSNLALTVIDDTAGAPVGFSGVTATGGDVVLTTVGTDQNLTLDAAATAAGATVKLVSSGAVGQNVAGMVTALTVAASGDSVLLTSANLVSQLSGTASTGDFEFTSNLALTVIDDTAGAPVGFNGVTATLGDVVLTTAGADQNLTLDAAATASAAGQTVKLDSSGAVSQTAVITATKVAASGDSVLLNAANLVSQLSGTASTGDFQFASNLALEVIDDTAGDPVGFNGVNATAGDVVLTTAGADQNLTLAAGVTASAAGQTVKLVSSGAVTQTAVVTATKVAASGDSVVLTSANAVSQLSGRATGAAATDGFEFTSNLALEVIDDTAGTPVGFNGVASTAGDVVLTTGGTDQNLTLTAAVTASAAGQTAKLVSSGAVTQTAAISATKAAVSGDSVTLTAANAVAQLSGAATTGSFSFTANRALTVIDDSLGDPTGFVGVSAAGALTLLTTAGAITQNAGAAVAAGTALSITAADAVNLNGLVAAGTSVLVAATAGNITQGASGLLNLGLVDATLDASAGNVLLNGVAALTANSTADLGALNIVTNGSNPTLAKLTLDFNVPQFIQDDVFSFVSLSPAAAKLTANPEVTFNALGSPAQVLQIGGGALTVQLGGNIVNFGLFNLPGLAGFSLKVIDTPVDVTQLFVIQNTVLTVPAVAPAIAPTVYNTSPDVEQDTLGGQQTDLAALTVFVKLYTTMGGERVWILGGLEKDKDGNAVESGETLTGTEVLPKLIFIFTETISGKWGEYTLELEEFDASAARDEAEGDETGVGRKQKPVRVVKATFKFNVKTQQELIQALQNIKTVEKLFQYFQELPSRGATPPVPSSLESGGPARGEAPASGATGGANLLDAVRSRVAKLAQAAPSSGVFATEYLSSGMPEAAFVVDVSADPERRPGGDPWETSDEAQADRASGAAGASLAAGFAGAAAAAVGVSGRRRQDEPFERGFDSWMAFLGDCSAEWF